MEKRETSNPQGPKPPAVRQPFPSLPFTAISSGEVARSTFRQVLSLFDENVRAEWQSFSNWGLVVRSSRIVSRTHAFIEALAASPRYAGDLDATHEMLLDLGSAALQMRRRHVDPSYTAEPGVAVRDFDEECPGRYKIVFRTMEGDETQYRNLPGPERQLPDSRADVYLDPWAAVKNHTLPVELRAEALCELLRISPTQNISNYIMEQLSAADASPEWRDTVVLAAEEASFEPDVQERVCERLLELASSLRLQSGGKEQVVWSAIRRGASLLPPAKVSCLAEFLNYTGAVDTRAVALQAVVRVFEPHPPEAPPPSVSDRAFAFATKFLDPDVFAPGEPSLIARNATFLSAAVGDPRLTDEITMIKNLSRPWFVRRVRDELSRIQSGWRKRGVSRSHPAFANLEDAVGSLD